MNTFSDDSSGDQKQEEKEGKGVGEDKEGYRSMYIQEWLCISTREETYEYGIGV